MPARGGPCLSFPAFGRLYPTAPPSPPPNRHDTVNLENPAAIDNRSRDPLLRPKKSYACLRRTTLGSASRLPPVLRPRAIVCAVPSPSKLVNVCRHRVPSAEDSGRYNNVACCRASMSQRFCYVDRCRDISDYLLSISGARSFLPSRCSVRCLQRI